MSAPAAGQNTAPATCNKSVLGARSPTVTTAAQQNIQHTQALTRVSDLPPPFLAL